MLDASETGGARRGLRLGMIKKIRGGATSARVEGVHMIQVMAFSVKSAGFLS